MLRPQPRQKPIIHLIVIGQLLILIPGEIDEYPWIDRSDTVQYGLRQIHLPFILP
jgi:hypothetical protein